MSQQDLTNQFNTTLDSYKDTYNKYIDAVSNGNSGSNYTAQLQQQNNKLMKLNEQIISSNQSTAQSYNASASKRDNDANLVNQNQSILANDKQKIKQMMHENRAIEIAQKDSEIVTNMYFYNFIIFMLLAALCIILFIKYSASSNMMGGNKRFKR